MSGTLGGWEYRNMHALHRVQVQDVWFVNEIVIEILQETISKFQWLRLRIASETLTLSKNMYHFFFSSFYNHVTPQAQN